MGKKKVEAVVVVPEDDHAPAPKQKSRRCRDVFWLFVYLLCFAGMVTVTVYAVKDGDVRRLKYGRDSEGNLCGAEKGVDSNRNLTGQEQLYYFNLGIPNAYSRCISSCPNVSLSPDPANAICQYDVQPSSSTQEFLQQVENGTCVLTLESVSVAYRCVPKFLLDVSQWETIASMFNQTGNMSMVANMSQTWSDTIKNDLNARSVATMIFQDLYSAWWIILVCCGVSFVISLLWFVFLQIMAGPIVFLTIVLLLLSSWGAAAYFLYNYYRVTVTHQNLIGTGFGVVDSALYNEKLLLALGIAIGIVALILTLVICCSGNRIRLAVQIIKEASKALRALPFMFVFPLFKYLVLLIIMAVFVYVFALLSTSGTVIAQEVTYDLNNQTHQIQGLQYNATIKMEYLQIYYIFGFLWTYNIIIAASQCTMAGAVAAWYWTRDKKAMPRFPLLRSLYRVLRYHLGSMAIGSLLIALTQTIRVIVMYFQSKMKGAQNKTAKMMLGCLQCFLAILEKFLKVLTKNAYIEIAVYGYGFFTAARLAFDILTRNFYRVFIIGKVGGFFIFLGKLMICFLTVLCGLALMIYYDHSSDPAANYAVPLIIILIFSYITASGFMSIFQMAINTIFLSFCEDCERNDGSPQRPYFMSDSLKAFTDKHKREQPKV